ncbi:MAG: PAS domain S-box protein [Oligoflexia bacterium]|nr:PAS domain S-box protein [Oligoflexia bacterium]
MQDENALSDSENKYRMLVETTGTGYLILNREGKVIDANQEYIRISGHNKLSDIVGRSVLEWTAEYEISRSADAVARCLKDGSIRNFVIDYVDKHGKITPVEISATVETKTSNIISLCRDITEHKQSEKKLNESEEKYRLLVEHSHDIIFTLSINGIFTFVSPSWTLLLGHPINQVIGKPFQPFVHPDDVSICMEFLKKTMETKQRQTGAEFRVLHNDGSWRWYNANGAPYLDNMGNAIAFEGSGVDITKHKLAEKNLKESEENLNQILDAIEDIVFVKSPESKLIWGNKAFRTYYGMTLEQLYGIIDAPFVAPDITQKYVRDDLEVATTGKTLDIPEECITRYDGSVRTFHTIKAPILDSNGKVIKIVGTSRDLTEYKKIEAAKSEAEEIYRAYFNTSPNAISITTLSGEFVEINLGFSKIFGYSKEEIIGKFSTKLNGWNNPDDRKLLLKQLAENGFCENMEVVFQHKNGSLIEGLLSAKIIHIKNTPYILAIINDITKIKESEREKVQLQKHLFHTEKLASIGTLAAGVAHEINNPLAVVMGNIEIIEDECKNILENNNLALIEGIKNATNRIMCIVNGIRTYAHPDTEHIENVDIHECIYEILHIVKNIYKKENIILETNFLANDYFIKANIGKIQQVIMNIVSNARDALIGKSNGQIKITTTNKDGKLLIEIADNGTGIPKNIISKLFDPFFTTKAPGKGTGLGLSICHTIINSFGGSISVESAEGLGTSFKIVLPAVNNKEIVITKNLDQIASNLPLSNLSLKGKVLVVDDEENIRLILSHTLSSLGLTVTEAEDGEVAYNIIKKENFDYVITDIKMPKMRGDQLIERVKTDNIALNTKFIVITGGIITDYSTEQRESLRRNADGYIAKPFTKKDIINILMGKNRRENI